jgi:hypothetical protein
MPCFNLVLRRPDELLKHNFLDKSRHCGRLGFLGWSRHHPPSCVPFAPSPLRDFLATTDALTPAGLSPTTGQVSLILAHELPIPPSPNTQDASRRRFRTLPLSSTGLPLAQVKTSPLGGRLVSRSGRIEFVILRMDRSPPVALHAASQQRSYLQLRAGKRLARKGLSPFSSRAPLRRATPPSARLSLMAETGWQMRDSSLYFAFLSRYNMADANLGT